MQHPTIYRVLSAPTGEHVVPDGRGRWWGLYTRAEATESARLLAEDEPHAMAVDQEGNDLLQRDPGGP